MKAVFGMDLQVNLESFLDEKQYPERGLFKCRIVYDAATREVTFTPYEARKVRRIKIVEDDRISYAHKFEDRREINRLVDLRDDCDDVLIIRKGHVTDCSYSNIVFRKGAVWYTPQTPLLNGTMREHLIEKSIIQPREIRLKDIRSFETFRIINAMLEFESPEIEVSDIVF